MNRNKLFEVMRGYGVQEILVDVIERIYSGRMVKFELESFMTIFDNISGCIKEYGMKINGKKSKVV